VRGRISAPVSSSRGRRAKRILVVDDDPKIVLLLRAYLERAGYEVLSAGDGRSALRAIRNEQPDLVVLDLMLPELDGMTVTRLAREESSVPILMLTARGGVNDRVGGLVGGADDYMAKPFAPTELLARVEAILRRVHPPKHVAPLRHRDLVIDAERREVALAGRRLALTAVEFNLLRALIEADGRVLTRDLLLQALDVQAAEVLNRSVDVYVRRLRRKLGDDARRPRYVATVRGAGYRAAPGA
jgi:DNA-binding response OmpR family regulator